MHHNNNNIFNKTVFIPLIWEWCCFFFFFLQLDPENTGFIAVENFTSLVEHHELQLDPSKLDMLLALVQSNEEGQVCYQELIELVSGNVHMWCRGRHRERFVSRSTHTGTNFHTYKRFCCTSERLQNWSRRSRKAPQWWKLTRPFRSLSWRKKKNPALPKPQIQPQTGQIALQK